MECYFINLSNSSFSLYIHFNNLLEVHDISYKKLNKGVYVLILKERKDQFVIIDAFKFIINIKCIVIVTIKIMKIDLIICEKVNYYIN